MNPHNLVVGQKLWFIAMDQLGRTLGGTSIEIKTIGRRWATTSNHGSVDLETLKAHPKGYPLGQAYLSKEAYEADNRVERMWRTLASAVHSKGYAPPDGVTIEDMAEAARLLRLPLEVHR